MDITQTQTVPCHGQFLERTNLDMTIRRQDILALYMLTYAYFKDSLQYNTVKNIISFEGLHYPNRKPDIWKNANIWTNTNEFFLL
mgnify:CR=1 FL=1